MPLTLNRQIVTRIGVHPPIRDQIADHIRQAIATGDLQPGERIPSEPEIATLVEADRTTVRYALSVLANEGLLIRRRGKPTLVAEKAPVRQLDTQRYREELARLRAGHRPDTAAFVTDHGAIWDAYTCDPIEYDEEPANDADAHYLQVKKGTKVMRRRMVKRLDDKPIQIQRSTVPMRIAKGTVLADQKAQPYPGGTLAELYDAGLIPDGATLTVIEEATGRMPNTRERQLLQLEVPGPVWDIVRVFLVNGVPVEVSRVIAPMARNVLRFETEIGAS
jgi:GntR family transcriptional regulator